jgi:lipopolysaccharide export system protein LptA
MRSWLTLICLALVGGSALAAPLTHGATGSIGLDEMDIVAKQSEYDGHAHQYLIKGDVRVTLKDMVVTCDQATIFVTAKEDRVDKLIFSGRVEARRHGNTFRGDRVTYFVGDRRLLAEGATHTRLLLPTAPKK